MVAQICDNEGCSVLAMPPGAARRRMGSHGLGGLCDLHALAAGVRAGARSLPETPSKANKHVEPYRDWLNTVLASGTLTYKGHTVRDIRTKELATIVGLHRVTVSTVVNGHTSVARPTLWKPLTPFMLLCSTEASWTVSVGQRVDSMAQLRYLPTKTVVLDPYGRAWQHRHDMWCPAHPPGVQSRYMPDGDYRLHFPVKVLHLPPVLHENTTA